MWECPNGHGKLNRVRVGKGMLWDCQTCHGRAMSVSTMRKKVEKETAQQLWRSVLHGEGKTSKDCMICTKPMREIYVDVDNFSVPVDVCRSCAFVWFDASEDRLLPKKKVAEDGVAQTLPPEGAKAVALAKVEGISEKAEQGETFEAPNATWKYIPGLMGMPVEVNSRPLRRWPWLTWLVATAIFVASVIAFGDLQTIVNEYGLIPNQWARGGGITIFSSFLLHGSIAHLLGNLYFLLTFGDNVEDYLGPLRFVLMLVCAIVVANMTHVLFDPRAAMPAVGASDAISAIFVFYALRFPKARLGFFFWFFPVSWIRIPVWLWAIFWGLLQALLAWQQIAGFGHVSALAHLGGALVGLVFWFFWGRTDMTKPALA